MSFEDFFRLSVHAVITDPLGQVLQLKATYAGERWGLPGGALDPDETIHEALLRECREELGGEVEILYLSGVYFHAAVSSHAFVFRCALLGDGPPRLSPEHSAWRYFPVKELSGVQRARVEDCLSFTGTVRSARF